MIASRFAAGRLLLLVVLLLLPSLLSAITVESTPAAAALAAARDSSVVKAPASSRALRAGVKRAGVRRGETPAEIEPRSTHSRHHRSILTTTSTNINAESNKNTDFKTEPSFDLAVVDARVGQRDLAPGYLFVANERGLQIYDVDFNLVWYRAALPDHRNQDFRPCDYLGQKHKHLCWHETKRKGHLNTAKFSANVIHDQTYSQVGSNYTRGIAGVAPNLHAFHMLPGGHSFLQPVYVPRKWDLTPYGGDIDGQIWDGCFQEIQVATGKSLFEWCAAEHHPIWQTSIFFTEGKLGTPLGQTNATSRRAGRGTESFPFDFFHINAIDKNDEGDYFVSSRHFDQILKIAGSDAKTVHGVEPGTTLWRLGGKGGDISLEGFTFSKQHAVRHVSTTASETVILLLDNAWEGTLAPTSRQSAGQIIKINNSTMQATLLRSYPHPLGELTPAMGDMQPLPNGNILIGWGDLPQITEYSANGSVLSHAHFESADYRGSSYRVFKSPWHGAPTWSPKLLAYQSSCDPASPLYAYVSWNGATEVHSWRFRVAPHPRGPWIFAGTHPKQGFETRAALSVAPVFRPVAQFMPHVSVEALNASGAVLGTATAKTWVPRPNARVHCTATGCTQPHHRFRYNQRLSHADACGCVDRLALAILAFCLVLIEALAYSRRTLCVWVVERWCGDRDHNCDYGRSYVGGERFRDVESLDALVSEKG